ncbi:hypothetical protein AB0B66_38380 [Catellatospora sp. NPDC049111]|uniref:hypothetical protein n=1 Tax=Catellatospora sp. NPDC049111 TaxID=3155271 RepID=UPI0033F594FA
MDQQDNDLLARATTFVLDRLDAWAVGDERRVAELDAALPDDHRTIVAIWSAAFGIAQQTLHVLDSVNPEVAERTRQSFRDQTAQGNYGF